MKRLWKTVPPCLADTLGFQAVINNTEGLGVVDDCSKYKPLDKMPKFSGEKPGWQQDDFNGEGRSREGGGKPYKGGGRGYEDGGNPNRGAGHGFRGGGNPNKGGGRGYDAGSHAFRGEGRPYREGGSPYEHGGRQHKEGGHGGRGGKSSDVRVVASGIQEEDVIHGTEQKVFQAFADSVDFYRPNFAVVSTSPVSSMIGTDLDTIAQRITQEYGIPAASVFLDGQRDYLYGISMTLEAIGKLVIKQPGNTAPKSVNVLGYNSIDWPNDAVEDLEKWLTDAGYSIVSRWGVKETTANLERAATASVNLVVNIAGLRLAKWMESEFNIPYVVAAPFGDVQCCRIIDSLDKHNDAGVPKSSGDPEVLVICEQLKAEAIRAWLLQTGYSSVRVCSLFEMDKGLMQEGDRKINSEDDLVEQINLPSLKLVVADPDYGFLCEKDIRWIALPNNANQAPTQKIDDPSIIGKRLDAWMLNALRKAGTN